jgi:hypothetical protein
MSFLIGFCVAVFGFYFRFDGGDFAPAVYARRWCHRYFSGEYRVLILIQMQGP